MNPILTVILPAYNGAKWIEKSIRSVLAQSFSDFEFIIINDGSTDNTEEIVLKLAQNESRIRYRKNGSNLGIQKTRNIALADSLCEYVAEIDQDDEWIDQDKLSKQIDFFQNNKEHVLVGTGAVVVDTGGREIARYLMLENDLEIRKKILRRNCFIHSSVMYRLKPVMKVGGYTVSKMSEDHDLWLRLGRVGKFANLPEFCVKYLFNAQGYNSQDKIIRLKQNLLIAKENKDFYPNYWEAQLLGWAKIFFYPIFNLMPSKIKGKLLKLHKNI